MLLLAVAGASQAFSLAWPWARGQGDGWLTMVGGYGRPLWWLQILSLAVLVHALLLAPTAGRAALRGWAFATAWLAATFWWLFISMHTYGGLAAPLAVAAVLALAAFLGGYYAIVSWFFKRISHVPSALAAMVLLRSGPWPSWHGAGCGQAFPGGGRLCPCGRPAIRAAALDRRLRHGLCGGLDRRLAGAAGRARAGTAWQAASEACAGQLGRVGAGLGRAVVGA